jgi:predicted RNase H-like HicB family nuclease
MSEKKIARVAPPYSFESYSHIIEPLKEEDGGGYLITFPDLPGCVSDGESIAEALFNAKDSFNAWVSARYDMNKPIPKPTKHGETAEAIQSVQRLPRNLHASLVAIAKAEGSSLNALITNMLAESVGRRNSHI